jgi:hypothetical protein
LRLSWSLGAEVPIDASGRGKGVQFQGHRDDTSHPDQQSVQRAEAAAASLNSSVGSSFESAGGKVRVKHGGGGGGDGGKRRASPQLAFRETSAALANSMNSGRHRHETGEVMERSGETDEIPFKSSFVEL